MKYILIAILSICSLLSYSQAPDPTKVKKTVYVKVPGGIGSGIDSILMASKYYVNTNFLDSQSTNYNNTRILSYKNGVVVDSTGVIAGSGSITSYQTETASGATTFTFVSVPSSYDDYIVFVNGTAIRPTIDYTTSGNIITISTIVLGDIVRFQRIK